MSLDQLIIDCKKQQHKAQEELYKRFSGKIFGVCVKYAPNYTEAEDILQDAFIIIYNKIGQYKNKGSFEGWLKRIAINVALQRYRKKGVLDLVDEHNIPDVVVEPEEEQVSLDVLLKLIQELPDRYRLVFNMYVLDGYQHKEISELLDITVGTSKSNLSRARVILKDKLQQKSDAQLRQTYL